jgi:dCTP deaminase
LWRWAADQFGVPIGRLPGDFTYRRGAFSFYFPLTTSILASILLTLIMMFSRDADAIDQSRQVDQEDVARARDDRAVRGSSGARGRHLVRLSSYGYDIRVATSSRSSPTSTARSSIRRTSTPVVRRRQGRRLHHPAELVRAGEDRRVLPHPARRADRCVGKSTYARCGLIVNVTPFEPEWEGYVTLEISNTTPLPAKVYANEGISQVLFFQSDEVCEVSYADKKGKYQKQQGLTLPRL